jgi:two-component system NtrC family sensor kinase
MKIRTKILLLFTLGAVVPLLTSHFFATRMVSASIRERIADNLSHSVQQAVGRLGDYVERSIEDLALVVDSVPFAGFPADDLHRALEIPYRQLKGVTMVALINEDGQAVAPPYTKLPKDAIALGREPTLEEDLDYFSKNVPLKLALNAEVALGPVYLSSSGNPRMVMARAYPLGDGETSWVLAVEVSLADICKLAAVYDDIQGRRAKLIDARGQLLCRAAKGSAAGLDLYPGLDRIDKMAGAEVATYVNSDGKKVIGVVDHVPITGWRLLLEQPEKIAMEPVRRSLYWTGVWVLVSLAIALGGGAFLSRELTRPIADLEEAAAGIAKGDYERAIEPRSRDEVGRLALAFNHMTAEIRAWSAELTERVEERTRALREAREQIMQTQKLAAIGELGSGVAHEINNPLTGVIGVAQLLQGAAEPGSDVSKGLKDIVTNARRVADIVDALLRLSQKQVSPELQSIDAGRTVESALDMFATRLGERGVRIVKDIQKDCRVYARENDLRLALNHIVDNAVRALKSGGRIEVVVRRVEGSAVQIVVADNGPGMTDEVRLRAFDPFYTTSNPGSSARGLGLPLVHRVVSEHNGRIVLDSTVGKGTKVNIYLPGAPRLSRG